MNDEEKKGPGRPRKYETDAERKKAYRERKKEEHSKLESRVKRMSNLQNRIDKMESKIMKTTYMDKQVPEEISEIHEQIKDRSRKYAPSELIELELHELKRIRNHLQDRYHGSYQNPLLTALESAIMPSVDREFDSRKMSSEDAIPYEIVVREKLAKSDDDTTPKIEVKPAKYMELAKKKGLKVSEEDLNVKRSTMEKKAKTDPRHWKYLKGPFRTDQLFEVFQELILFYTVEAEIARHERELTEERDIKRLEKRVKDLEKSMKDGKLREVKKSATRRKEKKDDS